MPPTQLIFLPNYVMPFSTVVLVKYSVIHYKLQKCMSSHYSHSFSGKLSYFQMILYYFTYQQFLEQFQVPTTLFLSHRSNIQESYISSNTKPHKISYKTSLVIANSIQVKYSTQLSLKYNWDCPSVWGWKTIINLKLVPIDYSKLSKYLKVNLISLFAMIDTRSPRN